MNQYSTNLGEDMKKLVSSEMMGNLIYLRCQVPSTVTPRGKSISELSNGAPVCKDAKFCWAVIVHIQRTSFSFYNTLS